jgi:presenilin-like A22 family membrane protease
LNNLILESHYVVYTFIIGCWFQVDEKQVEGFFCNSVANVYYIADCVSKVEQFLTDVLYICGVVKLFENSSICPLFLKLICVIIYLIFFEVFDDVAVCVRRCTIKFDDVVYHTFCVVLFVLGYFAYAFYHFTVVNSSVNEDGWRFEVLWRSRLFSCLCLVCYRCEYVIAVVRFC